jgi:regulatory protein
VFQSGKLNNPAKQGNQNLAKHLALNLLTRREQSSKELREKLLQKGFTKHEIDVTIQELQQQKLQSDARFAEMFIHSRLQRGYGVLRIKADLHQHGINEEEYVKFLPEQETWLELLQRVRNKRFGKLIPSDFKELAQQARFLQYRGFTSEQIQTLLKTYD